MSGSRVLSPGCWPADWAICMAQHIIRIIIRINNRSPPAAAITMYSVDQKSPSSSVQSFPV